MAMNTWACNHWAASRRALANNTLHCWAKNRRLLNKGESLHWREVDVIAAGINHQT
jgi:hypothetical protein